LKDEAVNGETSKVVRFQFKFGSPKSKPRIEEDLWEKEIMLNEMEELRFIMSLPDEGEYLYEIMYDEEIEEAYDEEMANGYDDEEEYEDKY
jgi:hypothetical protein